MKRIDATFTKQNAKEWKFRKAVREDFAQLVTESTQVYVDGKLRVHFQVLDEFPAELLQAMNGISYGTTYRTEGLKTTSSTLGFLPRVTIRRDFCTESAVASKHPAEDAIFKAWADKADTIYRDVNPELHGKHLELVRQIKPCWRLADTAFTTGIVNKDNALFYHLDAGNFPKVWSAMYVVMRDCVGGHLAVPELNIGFSFERPALILFDGQGLLHGVTALEKRSLTAFRYSVVFYSLRQLTNCGTPAEELERIRKVKTQRELKRAGK